MAVLDNKQNAGQPSGLLQKLLMARQGGQQVQPSAQMPSLQMAPVKGPPQKERRRGGDRGSGVAQALNQLETLRKEGVAKKIRNEAREYDTKLRETGRAEFLQDRDEERDQAAKLRREAKQQEAVAHKYNSAMSQFDRYTATRKADAETQWALEKAKIDMAIVARSDDTSTTPEQDLEFINGMIDQAGNRYVNAFVIDKEEQGRMAQEAMRGSNLSISEDPTGILTSKLTDKAFETGLFGYEGDAAEEPDLGPVQFDDGAFNAKALQKRFEDGTMSISEAEGLRNRAVMTQSLSMAAKNTVTLTSHKNLQDITERLHRDTLLHAEEFNDKVTKMTGSMFGLDVNEVTGIAEGSVAEIPSTSSLSRTTDEFYRMLSTAVIKGMSSTGTAERSIGEPGGRPASSMFANLSSEDPDVFKRGLAELEDKIMPQLFKLMAVNLDANVKGSPNGELMLSAYKDPSQKLSKDAFQEAVFARGAKVMRKAIGSRSSIYISKTSKLPAISDEMKVSFFGKDKEEVDLFLKVMNRATGRIMTNLSRMGALDMHAATMQQGVIDFEKDVYQKIRKTGKGQPINIAPFKERGESLRDQMEISYPLNHPLGFDGMTALGESARRYVDRLDLIKSAEPLAPGAIPGPAIEPPATAPLPEGPAGPPAPLPPTQNIIPRLEGENQKY